MFALMTRIFESGSGSTCATACCTPKIIWQGVWISITLSGRGMARTQCVSIAA